MNEERREKRECFSCGRDFLAIVQVWTDPASKKHELAPIRCPNCIDKHEGKPRQKQLWHASKDP